jgi:hypothetical protein
MNSGNNVSFYEHRYLFCGQLTARILNVLNEVTDGDPHRRLPMWISEGKDRAGKTSLRKNEIHWHFKKKYTTRIEYNLVKGAPQRIIEKRVKTSTSQRLGVLEV